MKSVSSGRTRRRHQKHRRTKKKKIYVKFPKSLGEKRKTASEQSQDESEPIISAPINSPMLDE